MKTVLIAVRSEEITKALVQYLHDTYTVHTCSWGTDALDLLNLLRPDALIIDLHLPGITGMKVLRCSSYRPSRIVALTRYLSEDLLGDAAQLGVNKIFMLPCAISSVADCLAE